MVSRIHGCWHGGSCPSCVTQGQSPHFPGGWPTIAVYLERSWCWPWKSCVPGTQIVGRSTSGPRVFIRWIVQIQWMCTWGLGKLTYSLDAFQSGGAESRILSITYVSRPGGQPRDTVVLREAISYSTNGAFTDTPRNRETPLQTDTHT